MCLTLFWAIFPVISSILLMTCQLPDLNMEQAKAEIAKNDTYLEKRFSRKLTDISAKQESALIKLRSDYEQNRDRWVDEIVSRVVG